MLNTIAYTRSILPGAIKTSQQINTVHLVAVLTLLILKWFSMVGLSWRLYSASGLFQSRTVVKDLCHRPAISKSCDELPWSFQLAVTHHLAADMVR